MNPPGQLSTEALHTITLFIYTSCNPCYAQMCTGGTTSWKSHML